MIGAGLGEVLAIDLGLVVEWLDALPGGGFGFLVACLEEGVLGEVSGVQRLGRSKGIHVYVMELVEEVVLKEALPVGVLPRLLEPEDPIVFVVGSRCGGGVEVHIDGVETVEVSAKQGLLRSTKGDW